MENKFAILGIHGKDVQTVEGNQARVRMWVNGGEVVDEDFPLPELSSGITPSEQVYGMLLKSSIEKRMMELEN